MTVTVEGRLPTLNEYISAINKNRAIGNSFKQKWQRYCEQFIAYNSINKKHYEEPVDVVIKFYEKDKRRDKDNVTAFFCKVFNDALQHLHILNNDNWRGIYSTTTMFFVDKDNPRIVVELYEHISL